MLDELYAFVSLDNGAPIIPMAKRGDRFIPMIGDIERVQDFEEEEIGRAHV